MFEALTFLKVTFNTGHGSPAKMKKTLKQKQRCEWATDPLNAAYHDAEWGIPVHDDDTLFEFLTLEGAQAGLSWLTVLKRRENYREAFAQFDPQKVSRFTSRDLQRLLNTAPRM